MKDWERYEETARQILKRLREYFGLSDVQGKQTLQGASGTYWEVDALATTESSHKYVIIECRLTKQRQSQANLGALAFIIQDIGGERGIIVTPKPLQKGAGLIAQAENIMHFKLQPSSTIDNFIAEALGKMFLGLPSLGDTSRIDPPVIGHGCCIQVPDSKGQEDS